MRIGFDAKRIFFNPTGLGVYGRTLIRGLVQYFPGEELFLYSPRPKEEGSFTTLQTQNVFVRSPRSFFGSLFPTVWRRKGVVGQLQTDRLSVFHGLSHELPLGVENTKIPSIVTIHDLIYLRYPQWFSRWDCRVFDKKFRHSCRVANQIVAVSQQTKQDLMEYFKVPEEKIEVVAPSCDPHFFQAQEKAGRDRVLARYGVPKDFILFVGSLTERKNPEILLKAMQLGSLPEDISVVFVGRGEKMQAQLKQRAEKAGLSERVVFLSHVPTEDLSALYQSAKTFVYPSIFEGFGIPVLEALASRVPVITAKGSSLEEVGAGAVQYIDPHEPYELATALELNLTNSGLRAKITEKGYQQALKFHPEVTTRSLMGIYSKFC